MRPYADKNSIDLVFIPIQFLTINQGFPNIDVGIVDNASFLLATNRDPFAPDETALFSVRRQILLQTGPDIGEGNRLLLAEELRPGPPVGLFVAIHESKCSRRSSPSQ